MFCEECKYYHPHGGCMLEYCPYKAKDKQEDEDEGAYSTVTVLFVSGGKATLLIPSDCNPEDEIAMWCHIHHIAEDNVADFIIENEGK